MQENTQWNIIVSVLFDLSKVASARSVTEQYKAEFGSDPTIHSLRSYAAVQVFAKALENLEHQIHLQ
jgi:ABC-type branched-subunit amino acid transport system substrate-binding protein